MNEKSPRVDAGCLFRVSLNLRLVACAMESRFQRYGLDAGVNQLVPGINPDFEIIFPNFLLTRSERLQRGVDAEILMKLFYVGQKWVARHSLFGTTFGEVIEVSDEGRSGVVVVTDDQGNELDTFSGTAADFQASGEWQLAD